MQPKKRGRGHTASAAHVSRSEVIADGAASGGRSTGGESRLCIAATPRLRARGTFDWRNLKKSGPNLMNLDTHEGVIGEHSWNTFWSFFESQCPEETEVEAQKQVFRSKWRAVTVCVDHRAPSHDVNWQIEAARECGMCGVLERFSVGQDNSIHAQFTTEKGAVAWYSLLKGSASCVVPVQDPVLSEGSNMSRTLACGPSDRLPSFLAQALFVETYGATKMNISSPWLLFEFESEVVARSFYHLASQPLARVFGLQLTYCSTDGTGSTLSAEETSLLVV